MIHDLVKYPPMQSLLYALSEHDLELYLVGVCSDPKTRDIFKKRGVSFINIDGSLTGGQISRIRQQRKYRNALLKMMKNYSISKMDLLWFEYSYAVHMLAKELMQYRYVAHFYEFVNENLSWKYKFLYPWFSMKKYLQGAAAVIHCEYNRAIITKGLYELSIMPYVLPNKPYFEESIFNDVPQDIQQRLDDFNARTKNKKIILYQGVFESNERRLEEFCQAIEDLPREYVFVAMGSGGDYYRSLKEKYESNRCLFVPFIRPPYHLLVTQRASIGVLTYYPLNSSFAGVINPLYCAPNKVFEFSKYGIPMIANDIPGLKYIFEGYQCGKVVTYPITPAKIASTISSISEDEERLKDGSLNYYDSVNFSKIVKSIINDINNNKEEL